MVVRGVSPLIVRTLVVSSTATLDLLHRALLETGTSVGRSRGDGVLVGESGAWVPAVDVVVKGAVEDAGTDLEHEVGAER